jgi:hypothetical protein
MLASARPISRRFWGLLWFAVGLAAKADHRFGDLFVYFGLGVNACLLIDVLSTHCRTIQSYPYVAVVVSLALGPVVREWPSSTVYGWPPDWSPIVAAIQSSEWLPWCSRNLFEVAVAGGATSSSLAASLAVLAYRQPGEAGIPLHTRMEAALGLIGAALFMVIYAVMSKERCLPKGCI